jgi:hypothetical protein
LPFGGVFFFGASILLAPPTSMPNWIILLYKFIQTV